jgi:hypothetical protein
MWVIEKFWKHIWIQYPKIHQKQTLFLMGQNLYWPVLLIDSLTQHIYKGPEDGCMQPKHVASVSHWQQLYVVLDCLSINTRNIITCVCVCYNWIINNKLLQVLRLWRNVRGKRNQFFFVALRPNAGHGLSVLKVLYHTQRRTTVGRISLDEWSAHRRDLYLYLTTHNTHNRPTSMPSAGFEPTISAIERPLGYEIS